MSLILIVTYCVPGVETMELRWHFTIVILDVGVAKLPLYWIWSPPNVHQPRFISFLCGLSVVIMCTYISFLCSSLILWSMKNIAFIPAGISDLNPCASRSTSLIFALSHSWPSLLSSNDANSDDLHVPLLMAAPAKCNQNGVYVLRMENWTIF